MARGKHTFESYPTTMTVRYVIQHLDNKIANEEAPARVQEPGSKKHCRRCKNSRDNEQLTGGECPTCRSERAWIKEFPRGSHCVYLIACYNLWKIGYTANLPSRLSSLRNANAAPIMLEFVWPGTRATESTFHRRFAKNRRHGEWFRLSEKQVELLKKLTGDEPAMRTHRGATLMTGAGSRSQALTFDGRIPTVGRSRKARQTDEAAVKNREAHRARIKARKAKKS